MDMLLSRTCITPVFLCLILVSACQRPRTPNTEGLVSSAESLLLPSIPPGKADWIKAAKLAVQGWPASDATLDAKVSAIKNGNGLTCELMDSDEPDKVSELTKPLPIWLHNADGKLSDMFAKTLTFREKSPFSKDRISFLVRFKKEEFYFQSLWQVKAVPSPVDKNRCIARADLCLKLRFNEATNVTECGHDWKWLNQIIAIPNAYAYLFQGGKELVSKIRPQLIKLNGDGSLVTYPHEDLPSDEPWKED